MPPAKKSGGIVSAIMGNAPKYAEGGEVEQAAPTAHEAVAQEVIDAVQAGDAKAAAAALKSFVQMCMDEYGEEPAIESES